MRFLSKNRLLPEESALLRAIDFDPQLMAKLKHKTQAVFCQLPAIDPATGDVLPQKAAGLYCVTTEDKTIDIVKDLRSGFHAKGYRIFVMDTESDEKCIAVIKAADELDILRYRRTDGINHGLEHADIVAKMAKWQASYGLSVLGCSRDWVHVEFDRLPTDLRAFAREVYAFCPDSVDQGVDDLEALQFAIEQMHGLWLWWD